MSPVDGLVQAVYFRPARPCRRAGRSFVLLPPGNMKVRFYVPEPMLARSHRRPISFGCDACPAGLTGKVTFISRSAEYTPPVIYSLEERAKLVYLIEARPADPASFRVGQPVDVTCAGRARRERARRRRQRRR